MSVPLGGTISTMVTNSPAASFLPRSRALLQRRAVAADGTGCVRRYLHVVPPRFAYAQGGLHGANMFRRRAAASAHQAHSGRDKLARVAGHVFRRAQIDVASFDERGHAGVGLRRERQGSRRRARARSRRAWPPDRRCNCSRSRRRPSRQACGSKVSGVGAVEAVAVFVNGDLGDHG